MTAVAFDTLKLARRLEGAGFSREQADGAAEALAETFAAELATKSDLAEQRAATKNDFAELRGDMAALRAELRSDMAELRAEFRSDVAALRSATAQWIVGAAFVNVLAVIGAVAAVWQLAHH